MVLQNAKCFSKKENEGTGGKAEEGEKCFLKLVVQDPKVVLSQSSQSTTWL